MKPISPEDLEKINFIQSRIMAGPRFFSFIYTKKNREGAPIERTKRTVLFGIKVVNAFERRGVVITGQGNWHRGLTGGQDGLIIERGGAAYVRGVDMTPDCEGYNTVKIFRVDGMTGLACGGEGPR